MKKLSALLTAGSSYLILVGPAFAGESIDPCPQEGNAGGVGFFRLCALAPGGELISTLVTLAFIVATLIALAFLIFGGIKWITSGGDKAGVESARNMIVAALIGLVITFLSFLIINFLFTFFGLGSISDLTLPTIPTI